MFSELLCEFWNGSVWIMNGLWKTNLPRRNPFRLPMRSATIRDFGRPNDPPLRGIWKNLSFGPVWARPCRGTGNP